MSKKEKILYSILLSVTLIIAIANIYLYKIKILEPTKHNEEIKNQYENSVEKQNNVVQDETNHRTTEEKELEKLKNLGERSRMEYYVGKYLGFIESKDYASAYGLLYGEFKGNYFKTVDAFKAYAEKTYPKLITTEFQNIERQGQYYILFYNIIDPINNTQFEQKFIVKENDYNNFELSFEVK